MFGAFLEPPVSPLLVATVSELHGSPGIGTTKDVETSTSEAAVKEQDESKQTVAKSKARVPA